MLKLHWFLLGFFGVFRGKLKFEVVLGFLFGFFNVFVCDPGLVFFAGAIWVCLFFPGFCPGPPELWGILFFCLILVVFPTRFPKSPFGGLKSFAYSAAIRDQFWIFWARSAVTMTVFR